MLRKFIPESLRSTYHLALALLGAALYGFPSRRIRVIGVTGTKGKTSTSEMISAIFEAAGEKTALINSIRIKVDQRKERNTGGRSMPGRAQLQRFLRAAVRAGCTVAIIEMTSEGARQHRHRGIELDGLAFLNLAPEHIESHGSYEAYSDAKFELGKALAASPKNPRVVIANADDKESARYLALPVETRIAFSLTKHEPWHASASMGTFTYEGRTISVPLPGEFSLKNALAAAEMCYAFGASLDAIERGLAALTRIPGRAEKIDEGQNFAVVVDYAHTPDSLKALYDAFSAQRRICVVSATGGGRDTWKRPVMGKIADEMCDEVIVTDEDPYDESPVSIMESVARGMERKPRIIPDRREAIAAALSLAKSGDAVLLTGKGTDQYIHRAHGYAEPWDDARIAREELKKLLAARRV